MSGRVVVAGGGGLIGRALTADLCASGREVVILSRNPRALRNLPTGARAVAWDGRTLDMSWAESVSGSEAIVNLAGENLAAGRWSAARKRLLLDSRVEPTRAIVAAIRTCQSRPGVLVQASGVGFYGSRGDSVLAEDAAPGAGTLPDLCRAWEEASAPVTDLGVRRVLLRTGVVLARAGGALAKMAPPVRWFLGGALGSGKQWWPWIHQADAVAAMRLLLADQTARGPFALTAPELVRNQEFSQVLARVLRRPNLVRAPTWALRLALGEMASVLLDSQRLPPANLLRLGMGFRFGGLEAALVDLLGND